MKGKSVEIRDFFFNCKNCLRKKKKKVFLQHPHAGVYQQALITCCRDASKSPLTELFQRLLLWLWQQWQLQLIKECNKNHSHAEPSLLHTDCPEVSAQYKAGLHQAPRVGFPSDEGCLVQGHQHGEDPRSEVLKKPARVCIVFTGNWYQIIL